MVKNFLTWAGILALVILISAPAVAQEFPIATGTDNTFGGGGDFDGNNFLFGILGDATDQYSLTAQLVSSTGVLVGPRISLGKTGSGPLVAFDGTNYLMVWTDIFPKFAGGDTNGIGDLYGQFISTSGNLVGTSFTITTGINLKFGQGRGTFSFMDTTYYITYLKGGNHTDVLYGQRLSKSGSLIGSPVKISDNFAREHSISSNGTSLLVAWCESADPYTDAKIYGQFLNTSGEPVGNNFVVDDGQYASDNPVTTASDGSRYLVSFYEEAADANGWNLFGRFVSPSGIPAERFLICDSSKGPNYPIAAFDGTHYLITWMESAGRMHVQGRFFTPTGIPVDNAFMVFDTLGGKFPMGGVGGFVNGKYLLSATRFDNTFGNGDIYGMFLQPLTAGLVKDEETTVQTYSLSQNYPNPFNPTTTIRYALPHRGYVRLSLFNLLGQKVAELASGEREAGNHEVKFDAANLASGVYLYRLDAGNSVQTKKLVLVR